MANKVYVVGETAVVFGSEGGDDVDWTTESIATANGVQSARYDRGVLSTAKAGRYHYRFHAQFQATPGIGTACRLYAKTSDGTHADNDDGTTDTAVTAITKLDNLKLVDVMIVDEAAANVEFCVSGTLWLFDRYVQFAFWNATGATTTGDETETKLILTPVPDEIQ